MHIEVSIEDKQYLHLIYWWFHNLCLFLSPIVRRMSKKFGMKEVGEDEDWTLYWTDYSVALERVMEMKRYQVRIDKVLVD